MLSCPLYTLSVVFLPLKGLSTTDMVPCTISKRDAKQIKSQDAVEECGVVDSVDVKTKETTDEDGDADSSMVASSLTSSLTSSLMSSVPSESISVMQETASSEVPVVRDSLFTGTEQMAVDKDLADAVKRPSLDFVGILSCLGLSRLGFVLPPWPILRCLLFSCLVLPLVLCCAVLCSVPLCCVMLCCVVLCCVVCLLIWSCLVWSGLVWSGLV